MPATLLLALGVFSLVADEDLVGSLVDRLAGIVPLEVASLLRDSLNRTSRSAGGGVVMTAVGAALALWTVTSAATTLMGGLTSAYERRDGRSFVRKRLTALLLVVALLVAVALVLVFLVFGPHLQHAVANAVGSERIVGWVWWTAQWPVLCGALLVAFAFVLRLGPDGLGEPGRLVTPGAVVAVVVWLVASGAFGVYSARFGSYEKTWGTVSAVVVTLVWLWLTSLALLFGAEVNAEAERRKRAREAGRLSARA